MNWRRSFAVALFCALATGQAAAAQTSNDGWRTAVYPVLGWVPLGIDINVEVPPHDGGDGGGGDIVDGRFDGAFLGGFSTTNGKLWVEADVIWAAVGGDVERPQITVDADIIYGRGTFGYSVAPNWFVTGGVRRFALKYAVDIAGQATFERKPGIWDPLVGVAGSVPGPTSILARRSASTGNPSGTSASPQATTSCTSR
jgi:hypothetical protein